MKKTILFGLAAIAAAAGLTACNDNAKSCSADGSCAKDGDKEMLYSGVLPAADACGTVYTLKLDYDDDNNYTDGDYTLVENSLTTDSITGAINEAATAYSEGDFTKKSKVVGDSTVEYLELVPDAKDLLGAASNTNLYFIVNADQSLTLVSSDLTKSDVEGLNYTLTLK